LHSYKVYCDESRQDVGKYMLLGGIWIRKEKGWQFVNDFENYCRDHIGLPQPLMHMKWGKVPTTASGKYYEAYKYLVDLYFSYNNNNDMFFRALVTDRAKYDCKHPVYYGGDYESGFYNLYCQLILYWLEKGCQYHIRPAQRPIKKAFEDDRESLRLEALKDKLNHRFAQRISRSYKSSRLLPPVLTVEPRPAKERRIIQIADILMGAVGYSWNKEHLRSNARKGKLALVKHIASYLKREDLCFETDWRDRRFNIFHFDTDKTK